MKPIKITDNNASGIEAALRAANGSAEAHTYIRYSEMRGLAHRAEKELTTLLAYDKYKSGATLDSRSGAKLPNRYRNSRIVTRVKLERRTKDWFLVSAKTEIAWREVEYDHLYLTPAQDAQAIKILRSRYSINGNT
jgi:hypothetical protein